MPLPGASSRARWEGWGSLLLDPTGSAGQPAWAFPSAEDSTYIPSSRSLKTSPPAFKDCPPHPCSLPHVFMAAILQHPPYI